MPRRGRAAAPAHERARRRARTRRRGTQRARPRPRRWSRRPDLRWTIFRPSVIFGREDTFLNLFARLSRDRCRSSRWRRRTRASSPCTSATSRIASCSALDDELTIARATTCAGPRSTRCSELVTLRRRSDRRRAPDLHARARAVEAAGERARAPARQAHEPRQPRCRCERTTSAIVRSRRCSASRPTALEAVAPQYLAPSAQRSPFDRYRARSSGR